jgi:hypothetical protein
MPIPILVRRIHKRTTYQAQLLTNAVATGNGEWVQMAGAYPLTVRIAGNTGATVEVDVSNDIVRPLDSTHGVPAAAALVNLEGLVVVTGPVEWIKARVTVYSSGTVNATLVTSGID